MQRCLGNFLTAVALFLKVFLLMMKMLKHPYLKKKKTLSQYLISHLVGHLDLSVSKQMTLSSRFSLVVLDTAAACSFTLLSSPPLNIAHKFLTEDLSLHLLDFSKSISAIHCQLTMWK